MKLRERIGYAIAQNPGVAEVHVDVDEKTERVVAFVKYAEGARKANVLGEVESTLRTMSPSNFSVEALPASERARAKDAAIPAPEPEDAPAKSSKPKR